MVTAADHPKANPPASGTEPAWQIARLFPNQGFWTEGDFLALNRLTNRQVELADGHIEVLDMPNLKHQKIVQRLFIAIERAIRLGTPGEVVLAAYPVRVSPTRFREPDLLFVHQRNLPRMHEDFTDTADLVVEVVSQDRQRDYLVKRSEYAAAGIREYWIVDPAEQRVLVLRLAGSAYAEHGHFRPGETATSIELPGLAIDPADLFA